MWRTSNLQRTPINQQVLVTEKKKKGLAIMSGDVHNEVLGIGVLGLDPDRVPTRSRGIQYRSGIRTEDERVW